MFLLIDKLSLTTNLTGLLFDFIGFAGKNLLKLKTTNKLVK